MTVATVKPEIQAIRMAKRVQDDTFTHMFNGTGTLEFKSSDLEHPELVLDLGKAGELIYEAIKSHPLEYFYKSYSGKYGKKLVPQELIEHAYYQVTKDSDNKLRAKLDFSKKGLNYKYLGKPQVRVIDDFVFKDAKTGLSPLLPAFFHLYNTRLKDERWTVIAVDLYYSLDDEEITFEKAKELMQEIGLFE